MTLKNYFLHQLAEEATVTRKMLALVPEDQYQWQPHPKSMSLIRLATHVAELPGWITMTLNTSELDFAKEGHYIEPIANTGELLTYFDNNLTEATANLERADENAYADLWTLRDGENIFFTTNKADVIRISLSQLIHHRAQLGVFLRLLNIPIPGSYGPSADEASMFEAAEAAQ